MIVTFYSYKGGVGRSMAMANVADILARRGARVLMIDFDLEAPGLEQYFQIHQPSARRHLGLLDLLLEFKHAMSVGSGEAASADFRDVRRFILPVYERLPGDGCLDLLPAGEREDPAQLERYALNVRSFDWQDFYFNWEGELFFEWLRGQLVPERYDLVLVDSRTGVTEMGGICAYQLGDVIVMMCAANHQNVRGTQNVAADFLSPQVLALRQNRPPQIVVVPARIEQRRQELLDEFMARFEATFGDRVPEALRARGMGFADLLVPYEPQYAFDERILADPANVAQRERIATAFHRLADAMTYLAAPGTRLAALARDAGGTVPQVAAQYDLTARFAGYDAYIVTATADSATAEAFAAQLKRADLRAFVDELEAVPPPEWQRRSEQQLFHSRALVVFIGPGGLTPAQSEGLQRVAAAVRASREFVTIKVLLPGASLAPTPGRQGTALGGEFFDLREGVPANGLDPLVTRIAALAPVRPAPADAGAPPEGADPDYTLTWTTGGTAVAVSSPFRPLERFQEHDAAFFFGREGLRASLLDHLRTQARVWVLGPSGSGKRSLVMAGAFSELRRSQCRGRAPPARAHRARRGSGRQPDARPGPPRARRGRRRPPRALRRRAGEGVCAGLRRRPAHALPRARRRARARATGHRDGDRGALGLRPRARAHAAAGARGRRGRRANRRPHARRAAPGDRETDGTRRAHVRTGPRRPHHRGSRHRGVSPAAPPAVAAEPVRAAPRGLSHQCGLRRHGRRARAARCARRRGH